eukprot:COSAG06_NODE_10657_length_1640_cov_3.101233_2_plen_88_part_00
MLRIWRTGRPTESVSRAHVLIVVCVRRRCLCLSACAYGTTGDGSFRRRFERAAAELNYHTEEASYQWTETTTTTMTTTKEWQLELVS